MKKLSYLIIALLMLLGLAACDENDPDDNPILGYSLDQFISADEVRAVVDSTADETDDFRSLFAYEIVSGDDGFSPRLSVNAGYDLPWDTFTAGYIVPSDNHRTWFPTSNLPGAFRVQETGLFRLYRKVDVNIGRSSKLFELRGQILYPTANWVSGTEDAIKLSDLMQGIAVYDSVQFVAADGYTKTYLPELISDGYYLLDSEVTTFPTFNSTLPNSQKKFKKLAAINVYGAEGEQNVTPELAPIDTADIIFNVPENLSGFTSTELDEEAKLLVNP